MVFYINDSGIFRTDNSQSINSASQVNRIEKLKNVSADTDSVVREAQKAYVIENTPAYNISISSAGKAAIKSLKVFNEGLSKLNEGTNFQNLISTNLRNTDEAKTGSYTNRFLDNTDSSVTSIYDNQQPNVSTAPALETGSSGTDSSFYSETLSGGSVLSSDSDEEDTAVSSSVSPNNLTRYTEFQLRQMVLDGTITSSDMNDELDKRANGSGLRIEASQEAVMKQAVAAYDYQMAYQINTAMTQ